MHGSVQKLVLVLTDAVTSAVIERWTFDIIHEKQVEGYAYFINTKHNKLYQTYIHSNIIVILQSLSDLSFCLPIVIITFTYTFLIRQQPKPEAEILKEIQAIIRQITASVTFLPIIEGACLFELLVQTDNDLLVPTQWEESDPKLIVNSSQVLSLMLLIISSIHLLSHYCTFANVSLFNNRFVYALSPLLSTELSLWWHTKCASFDYLYCKS